ncbi:MAG: ABC transporter permease, partial [Oscillospiraceae bacterium]|nr:ABC transporter permease [Oscillospiraceae bacterium]
MMKISAFARRNIKQSKSVICMIALASMLICVVINLGISMQKSIVDNILEYTGDNQVKYRNITDEQVSRISKMREVALADLYLILNGMGNPADDEKTYIGLQYSSGLGQVANFHIATGRAPVSANEAVISPHLAELLGIEAVIGVEFEILYRRPLEEWTLVDFTEAVPMRFVVSGVLQEQRMYAAMGIYDLFVSKPLIQQHEYDLQLYLRFHNRYDPRSTALRIADDLGLDDKDMALNEAYLTADELDDPTVLIFIVAILLILSAAGALVIYNAYNLSIVKRVHQYGLLTVIGASKKQIMGCVRLEALYCAALGLPLGLLAGTLLGYAGLSALNSAVNVPVAYILTPTAYLLSATVTAAMVWLGVSRPAKRASRTAPVEAVRFSDAEVKPGKRKSVENVTMNALVKINMSRAKKRLVGTVLSLSLSGILFLSFSTVAFSMRNSAGNLTAEIIAGDIQITAGRYEMGYNDSPNPLLIELADTIRGLDGVINVSALMTQNFIEYIDTGDGEQFFVPGQKAVGVTAEIMQNILRNVYTGGVTLANFD